MDKVMGEMRSIAGPSLPDDNPITLNEFYNYELRLSHVTNGNAHRGELPSFKKAEQSEFEGLISHQVVCTINGTDTPYNANILGERFTLSINHIDTDKEKSRAR